jgi:hypothetical protein
MKTFKKSGLVVLGAACLLSTVNADAEAHGFGGAGFSPHLSSLHAFKLSSFKMPNTNAFCSGKHFGLGSHSVPHMFGSSNKGAEIEGLENKNSLNKAAEIEALENKNSLNKAAEMEALEDKHMFPEEGMYVTKNKPAEIAALEGKHGELNPQPLPPVYSPSSAPTPHGGVLGQGPDGIGVVRNPITGQPVTEGGLGPQNLPLTVQPEPTLGIANSPLPQLFPHENLDPNDF